MNIIYKDESYRIQGAMFEVYNAMGPGFLESVYQECLERELTERYIPFQSQPEIQLKYKEIELHHTFKPDFICYEKIIIEMKAVTELLPQHDAQIMNYLKATGFKLGLLVNFKSYPKLKIKRIIM
ncbi:MAG TPA: GxxExxY protein [Bacteroidetes bacterium]|nr:GxxExxY protein [Bacteroidota bacterium]HEX04959.1 GxxExxY protein [Bacteroidota bacterium]